jgi:hypothetical protein
VVVNALWEAGYVVVPSRTSETSEPWSVVEQLVGSRPTMVERQPIRPLASGRSFASTSVFTPFHTDSQDYRGAPPRLQVMICRRAAASGGETRLVDGSALLARLRRENPHLCDQLLTVARLHRFYFGDVTRPTVVLDGDQLMWTHSPLPPVDTIGEALAIELAREPVITLAVKPGETLLVDNHRMLHGREAFDDPDRDFVRLLAWLPTRTTRERLDVVLELLTGVPPAKLAAREGISEAELYAWRSRALAAAAAALDD